MTDQHPDTHPFRTRTVYLAESGTDGTEIRVDHVYAPDGAFACDECGGPGHDPGLVGIFLTEPTGEDTSVLLDAGEALVLVNRIQRVVALILESDEDVPDIEREAARFTVPGGAETDPAQAAVWQAWNALDGTGEPSPVKRVARDLSMSPAEVAAIVFPPDRFGAWSDDQEPGLPA
jgi:hypothetical protein